MAAGTRPTAVPVYVGQLVQFGSITTSVPFFDVLLPDGYSRFNFFFTGITVTSADPGDNIATALQIAGNFDCDNINNDTYFLINPATLSSLITLTPVQTDQANANNYRAGCLVDIYDGDVNNWPFVSVTYAWAQPKSAFIAQTGLAVSTLNPSATIPPRKGRATLMRVLPLGNGDCNPPTSGNTIDTGDWRLYAYN